MSGIQRFWRKSSYSTGNGGACVETAPLLPYSVAVRDSKRATTPHLEFPHTAWTFLTANLKTPR